MTRCKGGANGGSGLRVAVGRLLAPLLMAALAWGGSSALARRAADGAAKTTGSTFLALVDACRLAEAHALLAPAFRASLVAEDLPAVLHQAGVDGVKGVGWERSSALGRGRLRCIVPGRDGHEHALLVSFQVRRGTVLVNGLWRYDGRMGAPLH